MCGLCVGVSVASGAIAGWFGIKTPQTVGGRGMAVFLTVESVALTVLGLKSLLNISICGGSGYQFTARLITAALISASIALVYSFVFNYLIARFVELPASRLAPNNPSPTSPALSVSSCCSAQRDKS